MILRNIYNRTHEWEKKHENIAGAVAFAVAFAVAGTGAVAVAGAGAVAVAGAGAVAFIFTCAAAFTVVLGATVGWAFALADIYWVYLLVALVALGEAIFLLDKRHPKKPLKSRIDRVLYTAKVKAECLLDAAWIIGMVGLGRGTLTFIDENFGGIVSVLQTIGWYGMLTFGVVGIVIAYLYVNSLKFKVKKK